MTIVIKIPSGQQVTVSAYVAAWNKLRRMTADQLSHDVPARQWQWFPVSAAEVLSDMRTAMHDRINRRAALSIRDNGFLWPMQTARDPGRKWSEDWQRETRRLANAVNSRIVVRERDCPKEFRSRLAHRLTPNDGF
jgi:hypothetical protein